MLGTGQCPKKSIFFLCSGHLQVSAMQNAVAFYNVFTKYTIVVVSVLSQTAKAFEESREPNAT